MGSLDLKNIWEEEDIYMLDNEEWDEEMIGSDSTLNDPQNVPSELLRPCNKRPHWVCVPGREQLANFFLIFRNYSHGSPPFMIFSDMMGINLLHKVFAFNDILIVNIFSAMTLSVKGIRIFIRTGLPSFSHFMLSTI